VPAWRQASTETACMGVAIPGLRNNADAMLLISCRRTPQKSDPGI
jgi:hypothetical protein